MPAIAIAISTGKVCQLLVHLLKEVPSPEYRPRALSYPIQTVFSTPKGHRYLNAILAKSCMHGLLRACLNTEFLSNRGAHLQTRGVIAGQVM